VTARSRDLKWEPTQNALLDYLLKIRLRYSTTLNKTIAKVSLNFAFQLSFFYRIATVTPKLQRWEGEAVRHLPVRAELPLRPHANALRCIQATHFRKD
jgi:hypothetical protein